MFIVTVIVTLVLAGALLGSAVGKLKKVPQVMQSLHSVGVKDPQLPALAGVEVVGAAGLLLGLFADWLGVLAAIGVVVYFALAVAAHFRVKEPAHALPAGGLLILSVLALVLHVST